jgi:predicted RNA-binding protein with PUA-like domain
MRVVGGPRPDPSAEDPKSVVVEVAPVRALDKPVTLARIKEAGLEDWDLVRLPRLSVMPVTDVQWRCIEEMARSDE